MYTSVGRWRLGLNGSASTAAAKRRAIGAEFDAAVRELAAYVEKAKGIERKLVGFTTPERTFPRHGYPVKVNGKDSGMVRSGTTRPLRVR